MVSDMDKLHTKIESYEKKICTPEYMQMNKKENEVLILRAENSNLKTSIASLEKNLENSKGKILQMEKKIQRKDEKIIYLSKKMTQMEETMLVEGLQTSIDKEKDSSKNINFCEFSNNFNFSKKKEKENSEKKLISIKEKIEQIELLGNEKILDIIQNQSSNEKTNCSSEKKYFKKTTGNNFNKIFSNIFDKINNQMIIQTNRNEKKKSSSKNLQKINVRKFLFNHS